MHRAGRVADLASWHREVGPVNRFGLILVNTTGGPRQFAIAGGPGRPADLPRGTPAAVAMIHSFSAADLTDPQTIAARWLAQGAFVFFGSVHEPFLLAFRPPRLVAELVEAGAPLSAALRQGEFEPFGFPWRLVYLGDPLYRPWSPSEPRERAHAANRMAPDRWRLLAPEYEQWRAIPITANDAPRPPAFDSDRERLLWCVDMAIVSSVAASTRERAGQGAERSGNGLRPCSLRPVAGRLANRASRSTGPAFEAAVR